ncbi:hypothetical protein BU17DRAFT_99781 [Hysterangium stoloniferum]|nr:hypothetical protein BU17DRAFT_99781 [Hysterangium stoloniferum]
MNGNAHGPPSPSTLTPSHLDTDSPFLMALNWPLSIRSHSQTSTDGEQLPHLDAVGALQIFLLSPFPSSKIHGRIPSSVSRIFVVEQIRQWPTKYTPFSAIL